MMYNLKYCNSIDVFPVHSAVAKMSEFYEQHKIDLLKETLSMNGAANKTLSRSNKDECIFVFGFNSESLYQSVRSNVVGDPSIVFNHYEKVNETVIDDANVESILGYDANVLYFWLVVSTCSQEL